MREWLCFLTLTSAGLVPGRKSAENGFNTIKTPPARCHDEINFAEIAASYCARQAIEQREFQIPAPHKTCSI